jgi:hypothetical protein
MKRILVSLMAATLFAAPITSQATTFVIRTPEYVVRNSPLIVSVIVKNIQYVAASDTRSGMARITLTIVDRIVGTVTGIQSPGNTMGVNAAEVAQGVQPFARPEGNAGTTGTQRVCAPLGE